MLSAALHMTLSAPLHTQMLFHGLSHHLAMWQSLPAGVHPQALPVPTSHDFLAGGNQPTPDAGGCVDSPEAATVVLMAMGALGLSAGSWIFRRKTARL